MSGLGFDRSGSAARPKSSMEIMSEVMVRAGLDEDRAVTAAFACYQKLVAEGFEMQRSNHVAARRLDQQEHEWVMRLERLIVDDIFPYRVDEVAHAKEFRLVAHMIKAGR